MREMELTNFKMIKSSSTSFHWNPKNAKKGVKDIDITSTSINSKKQLKHCTMYLKGGQIRKMERCEMWRENNACCGRSMQNPVIYFVGNSINEIQIHQCLLCKNRVEWGGRQHKFNKTWKPGKVVVLVKHAAKTYLLDGHILSVRQDVMRSQTTVFLAAYDFPSSSFSLPLEPHIQPNW